MTAFECFELGKSCGLGTVKEAVAQEQHLAIMTFAYSEIGKEEEELKEELKRYGFITDGGISDMSLDDALSIINKTDGTELKYTEY